MATTTTATPVISIIIPCYNHAETLAETIQSVLASDFERWEAIIVNDGSTDQSDETGKHCASLDTRIKYISQENAGPAAARNHAIRLSRGKYILPLDADDLIHPAYIGRAVEYLEQHEECAVYYCKGEFFGGKEGPFQVYWRDYRSMLVNNSIFSSCVYRRRDFDRVGGYDESMRISYEDWEFNIRLLYHNDIVFQSPEVMFYYRKGKDGTGRDDSAVHLREKVCEQVMLKNVEKYVEYYGSYPTMLRKFHPEEIHRNEQKLKKRLRGVRILSVLLGVSLLANVMFLLSILLG